jgi:hypothetical protein
MPVTRESATAASESPLALLRAHVVGDDIGVAPLDELRGRRRCFRIDRLARDVHGFGEAVHYDADIDGHGALGRGRDADHLLLIAVERHFQLVCAGRNREHVPALDVGVDDLGGTDDLDRRARQRDGVGFIAHGSHDAHVLLRPCGNGGQRHQESQQEGCDLSFQTHSCPLRSARVTLRSNRMKQHETTVWGRRETPVTESLIVCYS